MASRMDRYNQSKENALKRSEMHAELYHKIYDVPEYSNIEAIATMEKTNEIDITKLKKTLENREDYQRGKDYRNLVEKRPEPKVEPSLLEESKTYDIRDILTKAKKEQPVLTKTRSLENTSYNVLKNLNISSVEEEKEELEDLIQTITNTSLLNKINDKDLSLDLLDDLKSDGHTTVSSKTAIQDLLSQARQDELKKKAEEHSEIDKSFYTSTFGFSDDDFEQLVDIKHDLKKNNLLIKILLILMGVILVVGIGFLVFQLLK